ncbi:hypothetical protein QSJ18_18090 [Gordonia sp. ABSL1-1]|uniref:hypothetical protein n=1 Tax=Gordonia sp. ABSL1-1 TaxID=3053923 RepID=UPI002572FD2B|nr:hypothetical protein [Gordonia sp. ABSL1-1]MDL9938660.1 hypothetical protein [Gordonia sp. ABSL1-1]
MNPRRIATTLAVSAAALGLGAGAGLAQATPGQYTIGGDVRVVVAVSDGNCATVTWPKGTTSTICDTESVIQNDITSGDRFGASVISYSGGGVACSVVDISSGDIIYKDAAGPGASADCLRKAN